MIEICLVILFENFLFSLTFIARVEEFSSWINLLFRSIAVRLCFDFTSKKINCCREVCFSRFQGDKGEISSSTMESCLTVPRTRRSFEYSASVIDLCFLTQSSSAFAIFTVRTVGMYFFFFLPAQQRDCFGRLVFGTEGMPVIENVWLPMSSIGK